MWDMAGDFERLRKYMGNDERYLGNGKNMCKIA